MTPVDEDIQNDTGEFRKERQDIDRFRKEQVRREIHQLELMSNRKHKKTKFIKSDEQRSIEKKKNKLKRKRKKKRLLIKI